MTNKLYTAFETAIVFNDSTGTTITLSNLAAGAIRNSAQHDRGAGSIAASYRIEVFIDGLATAGVVGEQINVWIATAHSTASIIDGDITASDAAGTAVALTNMGIPAAIGFVQTTTAADEIVFSADISINARYITVVVENATADNFAVVTTHTVKLIPIPLEAQDAP